MGEIIEITVPGKEEVIKVTRDKIVDMIVSAKNKNGGTQANSIDRIVINALDTMMQLSAVKTVAEGMGKSTLEKFQNPNYGQLRENIGKTIERIIEDQKITLVDNPN